MADTDFRVCPAALRLQAVEVRQASEHWLKANAAIGAAPMAADALGYFGTDIVTKFNAAASTVSEKLIAGQRSIQSAATGLETCATHFETVDAEWYRQFGFIDAQVGY
ncbi:hypothetical protein [Nocardia shimofusensis]|uniref:hypothetical protein n=1 Tax=Nocardia shimofusensis TaxID=228596 RepID=UPI0012EDDB7F|nr:hypothetical protein [Nocardia shimofusensis]